MQVFVIENGTVVTTFGDDQIFPEGLGPARFNRASLIEPDQAGLWTVQLTDDPINRTFAGQVIGMNFKTKADAVRFEVDWINQYILGSERWDSHGQF